MPRAAGHTLRRAFARDDAQIMAMEALLAATIFFGAVSYVSLAADSGGAREVDILAPAASDALQALLTLRGSDGKPVVDALLADSWRCAEQPASPSCSSSARAAATSRLRAYLPSGAAYELETRDATAVVPISPPGATSGPAAGASVTHVPTWSYGLAASSVSCRDPGSSVRVASVFLDNGNPSTARSVVLASTVNASRTGSVWVGNLTPSSSTITAQATTPRGAVTAQATVGTCAIAGRAAPLEVALSASTYTLQATEGEVILPGRALDVRHDLAAVGDIATLRNATLDVYAPASPEPMWSVPLGTSLTGTTRWSFPSTALHGCYATQLRATWLATHGATSEEIVTRILGVACVTLPGGHVPPVPMYRLTLRAWSPEWSG